VSRRTILFLTVIVLLTGAIVAYDVWQAPHEAAGASAAADPAAAPAAPPVPRALSRAALIYPGEFAADLAARLRLATATAEPTDGSPEQAVLLTSRTALVPAGSPATRWTIRVDERQLAAELAGVDTLHGVALLRLAEDAPAFVALQTMPPPAPEPIVAMRPQPGAPAMQYLPASNLPFASRVSRASIEPGDTIVDLDGRMVGFIGRTAYGPVGLDAALAREVAAALGGTGRHPHPSLGADLQTITASLRERFPAGALAIVHVPPRSDAAAAGLRAGQTYASASIGPRRFTTAEQLMAAVRPGDVVRFEREPGGGGVEVRAVDVQMPPHEPANLRGVWPENETGVPVVVVPGGPAARAGLTTGDRIDAVDLRPAQLPTVNRLLRGGGAALLTVERHDRRRFVWLPPPPDSSAPPPAGARPR